MRDRLGGGGGRRRADGARPMKGTRRSAPTRGSDATLGRGPRGLVGPFRRARSVRVPRLGRIITPGRAGGLLGMLVAGFLYSFATGSSDFAVAATRVPELRWTDEATVRSALGLTDGTNVFRIDTRPLEAALEALPAVASAEVAVVLPEAEVVVEVREREAILAWQAGDTRFLADREGVLFAAVPADAALPAGLAVVDDRRLDAADRLAIGERLDTVDLDVATRLGSLTPADVGSAASRLRIRVTETDGFVVLVERGWAAVFGFYSPATRPTDMIPGQVRLLRSMLFGQEDRVARIILASETSGTYVPRPTPRPTPR